ncbi:D-amino-acid oxidase-like [Ornithodoros turicata]|uniref:D-amino-acid oxidase-like n=1 Tax=Ornithodoros turicata TaxID=34597 RepID=UPI003139D52F
MPVRIAVVGAGIIGLTTAVKAIETLRDVHITILADKFTPETTGDVAAGFLDPSLIKGVPEEKVRDWCVQTSDFYLELLRGDSASDLGLCLIPAYFLKTEWIPRPLHADAFLHYRDMTAKELQMFPSKYRYGAFFVSMIIECKRFLPYLMRRFERNGGKLKSYKVHNLEELASNFDVVVNCSGVGASAITADDILEPVRGQTIRVHAPWIKHVVLGDGFHVIPNIDNVMLGGTKDFGNWSLIPDPKIRDTIWNGCVELIPSIKKAKIVEENVGLRPGRDPVRIEREQRSIPGLHKKLPIIHNYGHGGSGITVCWGCADDAVELLKGAIEDGKFAVQKSRL